jgi:hypothetical protein
VLWPCGCRRCTLVLSENEPCYKGSTLGDRTTASSDPSIPGYSAFTVFYCISYCRPTNFNAADQPGSDPASTDNCRTVANQDAYTGHAGCHSEPDYDTIVHDPIGTDSGEVHIVTYHSNNHSYSFANSHEYSRRIYPFTNPNKYFL